MLKTVELLPGVTLRAFQDLRFKQSCLSVQFVRPMCAQEVAMNALLPAVLLRGTKRCPDLRTITLRLDDLYGASIGALVRRIGDYQTTGLYSSFIEDGFALEGDAVLEPVIQFLEELLLEPLEQDGCFCRDYVQSEKRNLIATIESQMNDKRVYAAGQLMKYMCSADSFGIPRLGTKEAASAVEPEALYAHYKKVLSESSVQLFYVGSRDGETVAELLKPLFEKINRSYVNPADQTAFKESEKTDIEEQLDVTQGKLAMGYVTPITVRDSRFAAMQVCNTVFGGGMTSKLFMNIRERDSLCYDIGSGYHGSKGIVAVSAGIDFDKKEQVCQQVSEQLEACRNGNITREELIAAKEALLNSLRGTHDSPGAIEGYYATAALSGMRMTPSEYMQAVKAVTKQDVALAAQTLYLHSVFFLKGVRCCSIKNIPR